MFFLLTYSLRRNVLNVCVIWRLWGKFFFFLVEISVNRIIFIRFFFNFLFILTINVYFKLARKSGKSKSKWLGSIEKFDCAQAGAKLTAIALYRAYLLETRKSTVKGNQMSWLKNWTRSFWEFSLKI